MLGVFCIRDYVCLICPKKFSPFLLFFFFLAHPLPTSVIYKMPGIVEEIHHLFEEVIMMQRVGRSFYTPVQS